jgi:hypothetical protein
MAESKMKAVYQIIEVQKEGVKPIWRRIGTAFVNRDESLSVMLDCVPLVGQIHVRDLPEAKHGDDLREAA